MNQETAIAIATSNLQCHAETIGFKDVGIGHTHQNDDGSWYVEGTIYKDSYGVTVTSTPSGDFSVSVRDLSAK